MKRAKHTLSHYKLTTARMGQLIPISCYPVLPGDTIQHQTQAMVRCAPLNTPVMHPTNVRIHHFFVPNRLTWPDDGTGTGWENFITGGKDGNMNTPVPSGFATVVKGDVANRLGVPPGPDQRISLLPIRAFNLIYNEYYRDQDLSPERQQNETELPRIAWEKDYFTTARPWTQKGPAVSVPIGEEAPVYAKGLTSEQTLLRVQNDEREWINMDTQGGLLSVDPPPSTSGADFYADLRAVTGVNVNEFREAFAIQRYQEARARYGSRFTEYLRYLGITPSDARLQRPEWLGGGQARLNFSEVLQTAPGSEGEAGVGDLYGHGIAGASTPRFRKFFEEHGYVITLMSVRPKTLYVNGTPREWLKTVKEDFYQRELATLGQQEVWQRELAVGPEDDEVFGYQDRYDEYRQVWSQVDSDFIDVLNSWHMGRDLPEETALNDSFVQCDPSERIFQVQTNDNLWIMANHRVVARRMVTKRANPRIL